MFQVFTDFHHASLLYSLILLFENRLGGNVYRPIGMEWAQQGFWKVYDHPATQLQYLTLDQGYRPIDGSAPLNLFIKNPPQQVQPDIYYCQDIDSGYFNKAVTLSTFYALPIDIVIASLPQHIESFARLCETHPKKPKLIYQIGNAWGIESQKVKNVMASARPLGNIAPDINWVVYHQEFDIKNAFYPHLPHEENINGAHCKCMFHEPEKLITSYVNCFNVNDYMSHDWQLFQEIERSMPEWEFKSFGGQCRDNPVGPARVVGDWMRKSRFIWHTKAGGDGYGHVIHNAASVARPLIVKKQYYTGKLGEELMQDGQTCICIDNLSNAEIVNKITYYNENGRYMEMCKNVYNNFRQKVDFDKEEREIRSFLEKLQ